MDQCRCRPGLCLVRRGPGALRRARVPTHGAKAGRARTHFSPPPGGARSPPRVPAALQPSLGEQGRALQLVLGGRDGGRMRGEGACPLAGARQAPVGVPACPARLGRCG